MARILIVEDEPNMRMGLRDNLEFEGYDVEVAEEGKSGLDKILNNAYDLVLLDVMMPNLSGFDVCKTARNKGIKTPIILLTAKGEEIDKVLGLELGADDYITKPFGLRELLARVKAVLRRTETIQESTSQKLEIKIGKLTADFNNYEGNVDGKIVKMSHKEFEILQFLWNHKNETVSRNQLLENIWGYDEFPTTRTIDNFILKLRQKIETDLNNPKIILTVHGIGYKLIG
ncbi:MAG: response regulator transcription factor [Flammeovirgaceae bacterium]|nr:response regulator transcription factor [Flammeovirgaceae bacterium]